MGQELSAERNVWFTDRYGAEIEEGISLARLVELLGTIKEDDGDTEHRSISLTDEHEWNLEFYPNEVLFENVGENGGRVGTISGLDETERLRLAAQFLDGDLGALRAWDWN